MRKQNLTNLAGVIWLSSIMLMMFTTTWSIGLISKGLWELGKESVLKSNPIVGKAPQNFAQVANVAVGVFDYGGSTAWAPLRLLVDSAIQAERPELQLRYAQPEGKPPSSRMGIQMLLKDKLAFVQSSQSLLPEEHQQAQQLGFELEQIPVAIGGIVVAINPTLNISGLTLEQLSLIYSGEITNWIEVGGPDLLIKPYSRPVKIGGKVKFFQDNILNGEKFGANVEYFDTTTSALRQLANNVNGIYYASAQAILPQCTVKPISIGNDLEQLVAPYLEPLVSSLQCPDKRNKLNTKAFQTAQYPLTHYLYVIIKKNGGVEEQVGKAYAQFLLTPEGQKLISKAGFIPIH